MPIHRLPKHHKFVPIDNELAQDRRLSWEARGMLVYFLSKPPDWKVRLYDLQRNGPAGTHKINRILKELERTGYLRRRRVSLGNGRFDWLIDVYESPNLDST